MKAEHISSLLIIVLCVTSAIGKGNPAQQMATLYSLNKYKDTPSRAMFNFERRSQGTDNNWDLLYGSLSIGDDLDWFSASNAQDSRSLIRDLGELSWSDSYKVPVITPLPKLKEGKTREITVDSSGDTGKAWAKNNGVFVKAIVGHMYAMHVKDTDSDFYVLFRVESIERGDNCTISWQIAPSPEQ